MVPPKVGVNPSGSISAKAKQALSAARRSRTISTFAAVAG